MVLNVPGRRPVTVVRKVRRTDPNDPLAWARDGRGNAIYDEQRVTVRCSIQPSSSSETTDDGRDQVSTFATLYAPMSWPGGPIDAVEFDGQRWSIEGRPQRWIHPRLGHVVVQVREVSG